MSQEKRFRGFAQAGYIAGFVAGVSLVGMFVVNPYIALFGLLLGTVGYPMVIHVAIREAASTQPKSEDPT